MMKCDICDVWSNGAGPLDDHLAGKKHRANLFRLKTNRRIEELTDWRAPIIIDDEEKLYEEPQVKLEEAAEILSSLRGHVNQAQCRLNFSLAAAILLVAVVLTSPFWVTGVKAEEQASKAAYDSMSWGVAGAVLAFIVIYLCDLALRKVTTYLSSLYDAINARINKFETAVTSVPVQIQSMSLAVERAVADASVHAALVIEEKIEAVESKISAVASPLMATAQTGMSIATWIALLSAIWYLCRSLFVRHAEKKESLEKLTQSKVFKLFDMLALTVIVPMMLTNGLSFAMEMWKNVKMVTSMASSMCSGI
jgi:hypothetical protein